MNAKNVKVVIVDDAPFIRHSLQKILEEAHFQVVGEAQDGKEGVEVILKTNPHVVIMDLAMPKKSGLQATREVLIKNPKLKVVACSSVEDAAIMTQAVEYGCCDFLIKPFREEVVIETIQACLEE